MHKMYSQPAQVSSRLFYDGRIRFIMEQHSFEQREQLLGMVLQSAMSDRALSVSELMFIINKVEEDHQKSLEANYNEQWQLP